MFVTPDFKHLTDVLLEFANTMALNTGGADGVIKAIESGYTGTIVYSSGLQVSGTFQEVIINREAPVHIRTEGPTQLCYGDKELAGHSKEYHSHGFSSPVGKLKITPVPLEQLSEGDLESLGITTGKRNTLEFESGLFVEGYLEHITRAEGKIILMTFSGCSVKFRDRVLFEPSWGQYDMAVGEKIVSAFAGPADPYAFKLAYPVPKEKTHKIAHSDKALRLHHLYQLVRDQREGKSIVTEYDAIFREIRENYPGEWLLLIEILENIKDNKLHAVLKETIKTYLLDEKGTDADIRRLVSNGMELL